MICLCLISWLAGCATERVVTKPEVVTVTRVETVGVPPDLTTEIPKTSISEGLSYGQALELWDRDRGIIDILNARLRAIRGLGDDDAGSDAH